MKNRTVVVITAEQLAQVPPAERVEWTKKVLADAGTPVEINVRNDKHTLLADGYLIVAKGPWETRYERVWYTS